MVLQAQTDSVGRREERTMDLREAMKAKGYSNEGLAAKVGMPASRLAGYKSGGRALGWDNAIAIAKALDFEVTPRDLMYGNQSRALAKARDRGDAKGVLNAVKRMVSTVEKAGHEDPEVEAQLDELVEGAVEARNAKEHHARVEAHHTGLSSAASGRADRLQFRAQEISERAAALEVEERKIREQEMVDQGIAPRARQRRRGETVISKLR